MPLLFIVLLIILNVSASGELFNGTYHQPSKFYENSCGPLGGDRNGFYGFRLIFVNYCDATVEDKSALHAFVPKLNIFTQALANKMSTLYGWWVSFLYSTSSRETCPLPSTLTTDIHAFGDKADVQIFNSLAMVLPFQSKEQKNLDRKDLVQSIVDKIISSLKVLKLPGFTLYIKNDYTTEVKQLLKQHPKYGSTIFIEVESMEDILHMNLNTLASIFSCNPSHLGGIPYTTRNETSGKSQCQCVCPNGGEFKRYGNIKSCDAPSVLPNVQEESKCDWLAKCYVIGSAQSPTSSYDGTCKLKDLFGQGNIPTVQTPWDNYVFGKENILTKGAHIKVTTTDPEQLEKQKTYEWLDFQQNGKALMNNDFYFEKIGVHKLKVEASDYKATSTCTTEIKIVDTMPPVAKSGLSCPPANGPPMISLADHATMVQHMQTFETYVKSRRNDPCSEDSNCDESTYKSILSNGQEVEHSAVSTSFEITLNEFEAYETISSTIYESTPGFERAKGFFNFIHFCELQKQQTCHGEDASILIKQLSPVSCSLQKMSILHAHEIYQTTVSINAATQARTKTLHNFLKWGVDDSSYTIHEAITETVVGTEPGEGTYTVHLSEWFDIESIFTELAKHSNLQFDDLPAGKNINDVIKIRYMINNEDFNQAKIWKFGNLQNEVTFAQEINHVYFESWSYLGEIMRKKIEVQIHPHAKLDTCADFLRTSFYQSLATNQTADSDKYCTFPRSDFAELTIDFNHNVGLEPFDRTKLPFYFQNITCTAFYMQSGDAEARKISNGIQILQYAKEKLRFIDRLGIGLKHGTTAPTTPIEFDCSLWYKSQENKILKQQCRNTITFEDCEAPQFPTETESAAFKTCTKNCPTETVQPYGYCGDNYLQLIEEEDLVANIGEAVFTATSQREDQCCKSCGEYQCASLVDTVLNSTLKSCRLLSDTEAVLLSEVTHESQTFIYSGLFLVGIIAMIVLVVQRKTKTNLESNDAYAPLL